MNYQNEKCDRCLAIDEVNQAIDDAHRDINIAIINQDDYGVVLSENELKGLHEEWDRLVADECLCVVAI